MSIEKLIETLKREAAENEKRVIEKANEEAEAIMLSAKSEAEAIDAEIALLRKELSERRESAKESAKVLLERRTRNRAINRCVSEIRGRAEKLFAEFMETKEYGDFLARELELAASEMAGEFAVKADPLTADAFAKMKIRQKVLADEKMDKGFAVVSIDGAESIYSDFNRRFDKFWRFHAAKYVSQIVGVMENER